MKRIIQKFEDPWMQALMFLISFLLFIGMTIPFATKVAKTGTFIQTAKLITDSVAKEPDEPKADIPPSSNAVSKEIVLTTTKKKQGIHLRFWKKVKILGEFLSPVASIVGALSPLLTGGVAVFSMRRGRRRKDEVSS